MEEEKIISVEESDKELHDLIVGWCKAKQEGRNPYALSGGQLYKKSVFGKWKRVSKNKPMVTSKTKPNNPCPCGSGKKFKKCCS